MRRFPAERHAAIFKPAGSPQFLFRYPEATSGTLNVLITLPFTADDFQNFKLC